MTASTRPFDRWFAWALAASLLLHLIVAALFPYVREPGADSLEILRVNVAPLEILGQLAAAPVPLRAPRAAAAAPVRTTHVVAAKIATGHRSLPTTRAHAVAAVTTTAHGTAAAATAAPQASTAQASAQPIAAAARTHPVGGYMPFGSQDDPVLDPHVLSTLSGLGVTVTLTVVVGDDGRTKSVAFSPALDPQIESQIRSLLADANWDPAYCGGGIPCEKSATIKL